MEKNIKKRNPLFVLLGNEGADNIREKAEEAPRHFGLSAMRERHPSFLSGGVKQRLTIAPAVVNHGELVLMDEPTGRPDRRNRGRVSAMTGELAGRGKAVIVAAHDREFIKWRRR